MSPSTPAPFQRNHHGPTAKSSRQLEPLDQHGHLPKQRPAFRFLLWPRATRCGRWFHQQTIKCRAVCQRRRASGLHSLQVCGVQESWRWSRTNAELVFRSAELDQPRQFQSDATGNRTHSLNVWLAISSLWRSWLVGSSSILRSTCRKLAAVGSCSCIKRVQVNILAIWPRIRIGTHGCHPEITASLFRTCRLTYR